ncbi:FtsX-like permease family protein [Paenibacillus sp. 481]|uniref:FtsX-like permease family protein n=1 Tax=Paenibacillus sp. 481 TaxID=2835869 RepID=UPI001E562D45|nr:ABC transporter permease [Paenibacillus sp. 481]UHA73204.1 ABC transporter permease [Paenibacillus sp. 481]
MLLKLSMSGLKSKLKDYFVLLAGLIMSVSIFYMFQTLALNKAFLESNNAGISSIQFVFHAGSFLLAIITFFYIMYANSFLLSLRQKEFGMYMMLGAKKHKIMTLMFMETIVLGFASLLLGTGVGVGLAQGVGQLLMKQMEFTGSGYHPFYFPSLQVTAIFFTILFVLSAILNTIKMSRVSVLQLIHAEANTERATVKGKMTIVAAIFSLVLLAIGYYSMIKINVFAQVGIIVALITITSGTYLLFMTFMPWFINLFKRNKRSYEKGLNMFTFAQLHFRINSLTKVLGTVAMLIALGAGAISTGMAFQNNVMATANMMSIYDAVIHNPTTKEKSMLDTITFKESDEYRFKYDSKFVYYVKEDLVSHPPFVRVYNGMSGVKNTGEIKRVSDELPLGDSTNWSDDWHEAFRTIHVDGAHPDRKIRIVNEQQYEQLKGEAGVAFVGQADDFLKYEQQWKELDQLQVAKFKLDSVNQLDSKYSAYKMMHGFSSGLVFMGFFLGIAFLAMMASSLMFKILTGATKDISRYQMLRKIGVRKELLTKSIYKEQFYVFLFPAIVGIVHVLIGLNMFSFIILDPYYRVWVPLTLFIAIYMVYYVVTVQMYKRIVLPKEQ